MRDGKKRVVMCACKGALSRLILKFTMDALCYTRGRKTIKNKNY